jgi:hypothetical protein
MIATWVISLPAILLAPILLIRLCAAKLGGIIAGALLLFLLRRKLSCLESLSKKFKEELTDERGYQGDFKIGNGKNISACPSYTPLQSHA